MKFSKRIVVALLCMFMVITKANVIFAKTLTGDLESDPITIQQKQQKNSSITKMDVASILK